MSVEQQTADTGVAPDEAYTSIQPSDDADSESVATLTGHPNLADYVSSGLRINEGTLNWSDGTFDLTEGKAFWLIDEVSDRPSDEHSWHQCLFTSYYPGVTSIAFDASQEQHVFARCDGVALGDPIDSPKIDVRAAPEPQSEDTIRIATLDPEAQTVRYHNQNPDGVFESLEADSVVIHDELEAEGLIDTRDLADKAVTEPKLDDDAVSQRAAGPDSIGSPERIDESVVEADMADDAASTRVHQPDSVTQAILAAESVVAEHVVNGTLTTPKYGRKSITGGKVADSTLGTRTFQSRSVTPQILDSRARYRMAGVTTSEPTENRARSGINGRVGNSEGEVRRVGGTSSDAVEIVQGGAGRYYLCWNAEFDGDDWRYVESSEPAMAIGMHSGQVRLWTADPGSGRIDWETTTVNNGGISNAHALGGVGASQYLRKRGVVDIRGGEFTLLNHWGAGRGRNTSHDLVFENQPSGERIHMNYARPEMRMFNQGRFRDPFWVAMKNGNFRPGQALQLLSASNVRRPPQVGVNAYYYNNELRVVKDNGDRGTVQINW